MDGVSSTVHPLASVSLAVHPSEPGRRPRQALGTVHGGARRPAAKVSASAGGEARRGLLMMGDLLSCSAEHDRLGRRREPQGVVGGHQLPPRRLRWRLPCSPSWNSDAPLDGRQHARPVFVFAAVRPPRPRRVCALVRPSSVETRLTQVRCYVVLWRWPQTPASATRLPVRAEQECKVSSSRSNS